MRAEKAKPCKCFLPHPAKPGGELSPRTFDALASDLAMRVWNRIAEIPTFNRLAPKDFPGFYESIQKALRPYVRREK